MIKRKNVKEKCFTVLLLFTLLASSICLAASASETTKSIVDEPVQLRWTNISSISVNLAFNNGKGTLWATVVGQTGTTKITGYAVLDRLNSDNTYTKINTWDNLKADCNILDFNETYYVTRGYTYRLTITPTVYRNGIGETASSSKSAYAS